MTLIEQAAKAKEAKYRVALLPTDVKNKAIGDVADALEANAKDIIAANAIDMENGTKKGLSTGLLDRLRLDKSRIKAMADGLRQLVELEDPIGKETESFTRPNGLIITNRFGDAVIIVSFHH